MYNNLGYMFSLRTEDCTKLFTAAHCLNPVAFIPDAVCFYFLDFWKCTLVYTVCSEIAMDEYQVLIN